MATIVTLDRVDHDPESVVTVGTFDGVHRGHQALLTQVIEYARRRGGLSRMLTFDPHPREVIRGERVAVLSTIEERAQWAFELGVDEMVVVPFTTEVARTSATEFVRETLVRSVGMREIVIGHDFSFGHGREGNGDLLDRLGKELGFAVHVVPPLTSGSSVVSSSEIRRMLLAEGNVRGASVLLGRPYELSASVTRGDGRGRRIGYPTANLVATDERKVVPARGVYVVRARLEDGEPWKGGMMNVGTRPTFAGEEVRIEVHLFDFRGDLYGSTMRVACVDRLRSERRFDSVDELVRQLSIDEQRCREILEAVSYEDF